jgi:putative ABC transport system permease protein
MNTLINWMSQTAAATRFSLQTIPQRLGPSAATLFGIAGVVAVMVGVLSIAEGFRKAMLRSGSPANAIVLRSGADSEMMSGLGYQHTRFITDAPNLLRQDGTPLASAELFVIINLPKRRTGTDANVPLRGVQPAAFLVHDQIKIVRGRPFQSGRNEVIVGQGAAQQFAGLDLGQRIPIGNLEWKVVGLFTANGGIAESEIWTDAHVLQPVYRRGNTFQSVSAKLTSPGAFGEFKEALMNDPRLNVKVLRQTDYYAEQSQMLYNLITGLGTLVAALMGIGAVFGALNTMYSSVSARTHEIATLRALGFRGIPVVLSVLIESLALALVGGTIGAVLAYLAFDGFRTATLNWQTFSQVTFAFTVTPQLLIKGVFYSALIGLIGGIPPALRAARIPVATALREG